jgi:hypothetical protein
MNTVPISEWLIGQNEGLDLDLVKKMVIRPVLIPVGADKAKKCLNHIQITRIDWWDKKRPSETSTLTIAGDPKLMIHLLAKYKRSHKPDFLSEFDKRGIVITTADEEHKKDKKRAREVGRFLAQGALDGTAALEMAKEKKSTRHYTAETIIIAVVLAVVGLLVWRNPDWTPFLVPIEIVIVVVVVRFYGRFDDWLHSVFHRGKNK